MFSDAQSRARSVRRHRWSVTPSHPECHAIAIGARVCHNVTWRCVVKELIQREMGQVFSLRSFSEILLLTLRLLLLDHALCEIIREPEDSFLCSITVYLNRSVAEVRYFGASCRHHCSATYHNIHFCLHCAVMTLWAYPVTFTANAPQNPSTTTSFKSHFDFERNPICRLTSIVGEKILHDANVIYFVVVGKKLCIQAPAISEKGIGK